MGGQWMPRVSLVIATLSGVLVGAAIWLIVATGSAKPATAFMALPAIWLWAAAMLNRDEVEHTAYGVTTAAGFCLTLNLLMVAELWNRPNGPPLLVGTPLAGEVKVLAQLPLALTALIPAAIGWWQRQQDRLADDESAD